MTVVWTIYTTVVSVVLKTIYTTVVSIVHLWTTVILKYAGTMAPTAPMAPILLVVGGAKVELAQALVPCETGAL